MSNFEILRERLRVTHVDPTNRSLTLELTIQNQTSEDQTDFVLELDEWLPGLVVMGPGGQRLPYLPRRVISERLEFEVEDGTELLEAALGDSKLLWVELPEAVRCEEVTVLRLKFDDPNFPGYSIGLIQSPKFRVREDKQGEAHDTFIEVTASPGSRVKEKEEEGLPETLADIDEGGEAGKLSLEQFVQYRLPGGHEPAEVSYRLRPFIAEAILLWIAYIIWTALPLGILYFAGAGEIDLTAGPVSVGEIVGTLGIAGSLSFIGFLRPTWANRVWFLVPLGFYSVVLLRTLM